MTAPTARREQDLPDEPHYNERDEPLDVGR